MEAIEVIGIILLFIFALIVFLLVVAVTILVVAVATPLMVLGFLVEGLMELLESQLATREGQEEVRRVVGLGLLICAIVAGVLVVLSVIIIVITALVNTVGLVGLAFYFLIAVFLGIAIYQIRGWSKEWNEERHVRLEEERERKVVEETARVSDDPAPTATDEDMGRSEAATIHIGSNNTKQTASTLLADPPAKHSGTITRNTISTQAAETQIGSLAHEPSSPILPNSKNAAGTSDSLLNRRPDAPRYSDDLNNMEGRGSRPTTLKPRSAAKTTVQVAKEEEDFPIWLLYLNIVQEQNSLRARLKKASQLFQIAIPCEDDLQRIVTIFKGQAEVAVVENVLLDRWIVRLLFIALANRDNPREVRIAADRLLAAENLNQAECQEYKILHDAIIAENIHTLLKEQARFGPNRKTTRVVHAQAKTDLSILSDAEIISYCSDERNEPGKRIGGIELLLDGEVTAVEVLEKAICVLTDMATKEDATRGHAMKKWSVELLFQVLENAENPDAIQIRAVELLGEITGKALTQHHLTRLEAHGELLRDQVGRTDLYFAIRGLAGKIRSIPTAE